MSKNIKEIIVATKNEGKLIEIREILKGFNWRIRSLKDFDNIGDIAEVGLTFYENSLIKAKKVYGITKLPVLADDSGICVEFLDGMPGVFSARFAGGNASDAKNNKRLLRLLKGVPEEKRKAYFKCVMVLVYGVNKIITATGRVNGYIADAPSGTNGFGYDPLFYLPRYKLTMAEIPSEKKNKISHRYKALVKLRKIIMDINEGDVT